MGCSTCSKGDGTPNGCQNNGHCSTGGCNKLNTLDWVSNQGIQDGYAGHLVEVSFKNGVRKDFFQNDMGLPLQKGNLIAVEAEKGYDIGQVSLTGTLVELQMKKKKYRQKGPLRKVLRKAHTRDIDRLNEARSQEKDTLIRTRAIIQNMNIDMKLGEVEYQGDGRKCTFYYTADGRVDFRELVRTLAGEFRVKVEMRQIGARQESAMIGGIGSCGRELCCSTWLSDFKSVSTSAARYQNLAINQAKLSGQCGRLKCCLNYELDTYMDALEEFPRKADKLYLQSGYASLIKTDIFKRIMYYSVPGPGGRNIVQTVPLERVKEILALNKQGEKPDSLISSAMRAQAAAAAEQDIEFADVTGEIDLPSVKRRKKRRNNRRRKPSSSNQKSQPNQARNTKKTAEGNKDNNENKPKGNRRRRPQRHKKRKNPPQNNNTKKD